MNEISFPLLDERRRSIFLGGFWKEDFFKHIRASMLMEARACSYELNKTLLPPGLHDKETVWLRHERQSCAISQRSFRLGSLTSMFGCSWTYSSGTNAIRMPQPLCTSSILPNSAQESSLSSIQIVG